ncbi:MAG: Gfo/Idh/MocA family protein [Bacteroidota bacterium]
MNSNNEQNQHDPKRRDFLKFGSAAAIGMTLPWNTSLASPPPQKKLRIGIVGGRFGCSFQFHEHPDCIVEAVSDLRPERREALMKTYQCSKSYPSLEELVKDKNIDAVAVFTEGPNHCKHVIECLNHGKHMLCAVPAIWGSVAEAEMLLDAVKRTGQIYMMAETSYYQQHTISARNFYEEGRFGNLYYCESEYQHDGLEELYFENGKRTWRYGVAPMHYPTHCTAHLISVTGERLTQVSCNGWGDDNSILKDNDYNNPFWNESALFKTDRGNSFRVNVWWKGAHMGCERAQWIGDRMSFYTPNPVGSDSILIHSTEALGKDDAGFVRSDAKKELYDQPDWWETDLLPEPLRHNSGHHGSHTFITHEFVDACLKERKPTVNIYEALAYTVPGVIAHESSLQGGISMKIPQFL